MIRTCSTCGQKNRVSAAHIGADSVCGKCKAPFAPPSEPIDADTATFDDIVSHAAVPVLVDFWAAWCGPCKMAAPEVAALAREMAGRALVVKVNTEAHPDLAARYDVRSIPNFVVLHRGRVTMQQPGLVDRAAMRRWLESAGA